MKYITPLILSITFALTAFSADKKAVSKIYGKTLEEWLKKGPGVHAVKKPDKRGEILEGCVIIAQTKVRNKQLVRFAAKKMDQESAVSLLRWLHENTEEKNGVYRLLAKKNPAEKAVKGTVRGRQVISIRFDVKKSTVTCVYAWSPKLAEASRLAIPQSGP